MENPYQSPEETGGFAAGGLPDPSLRPRGLVHHVRVLSILMIIQGILELLMAGIFVFLAFVMPHMLSEMKLDSPPGGPTPREMMAMMTVMWCIYGGGVLIAALLHIIAGIQNYQFQGRVLGIVAVSCGVLTIMGCYCLPTAIAIGIYGLIVYLNGPVTEAFRFRQAGYSPERILATYR